jgi:hypothetical protein
MKDKFVKKLTNMFTEKHYILTENTKSNKSYLPYHRLKFEISNVSRVQIIERINLKWDWEIITRIDNIIDGRCYNKELNPDISVSQLFDLSIKEEL